MSPTTTPSTTSQIAATVTQVAVAGDFAEWQEVIAYGFVLIDSMYRPHPIKRPLDLVRKWQAKRWWEQTIRTTGTQLQAAMMAAKLRSFTEKANRPLDQDVFNFHENNRQTQVTFDIDQQIRLARETAIAQADANAAAQIRVLTEQARLNPPPPPPPDPLQSFDELTKKIEAIEQDATLSDEQKRRRIDILTRAYDVRMQGRS